MNKKDRISIWLTIILISFLFCCFNVQADPLPVNPSPPKPEVDDIIGTAIINYPVNLVFLTIISMTLIKYTSYSKSFTMPRKTYVKRLLAISLIATILGAILDELLVAKPLYDFTYSKYYPSYTPDFTLDSLLVIIALALIFISFLFLCLLILKMNKKNSVIVGLSMAIINAVFWYMAMDWGFGYGIFMILMFIPTSIIISVVLLTLFVSKKQIQV